MKLIKKDFERMKDKQARDNSQVKDTHKKKSNLFLSAACAALLMIEGIVYGQGSANNATNANELEYSYNIRYDYNNYPKRPDGSIDYDGFIIDEDGRNKLANAMTEIIRTIDYESADNRYKENDGRINRKLLKSCDDYYKLVKNPALVKFWETVKIIKKKNGNFVDVVFPSAFEYEKKCIHFACVDEVQACINDCLSLKLSEKIPNIENSDSENSDSESAESESCEQKKCYFLNRKPGYNSIYMGMVNRWLISFVHDAKNSNDQNVIDKKCSDFKLLLEFYEERDKKDYEEGDKKEDEEKSNFLDQLDAFRRLINGTIIKRFDSSPELDPFKLLVNGTIIERFGKGKSSEEVFLNLNPQSQLEIEFFFKLLYYYNKFCPTRLLWKLNQSFCPLWVDPPCAPYLQKRPIPYRLPTYLPPSYEPPLE